MDAALGATPGRLVRYARLAKESPERIIDRVLAQRPDVIGLSALTIEKDTIHHLTRVVEQRAPTTVVVVGPYATEASMALRGS
jgi:chemotaxis response regulator CheB